MKYLILAFNLLIIWTSEIYALHNDKLGRVYELDDIFQNEDILKAIAFSVEDKTLIYKEIMNYAIAQVNEHIAKSTNKDLTYPNYYKYILENIKEYTVKWLSEEVRLLVIKTQENKNDLIAKAKRNIAEYIYETSTDHGVNLVLEGHDTSLDDLEWKYRIKHAKSEEL